MGLRKRSLVMAGCAWCALAVASAVNADTFYVDSGFSSLQIAVYDHASSYLLTWTQVTDSDITSLGGTFDATISGGYITFNSGSITFNDQGTDMMPAIGGGGDSAGDEMNPYPADPGSDPANYGLYLTVPNDPEDPEAGIALAGVAAIRSAGLDLSSSAIAISSDVFDVGGITLGLSAGTLDYNINAGDGTPYINGTTGIDGNSGPNASDSGLIIPGDPLGIFIPVFVDVHVTSGGLDVDVVLTGQIAATNAAPAWECPNRDRSCWQPWD